MVMNSGLQKHTVNRMLRERGVDPASVDLDARLDSTLHLDENLEELGRELGRDLNLDDDYEEKSMTDEEYRRMLRDQGGGSLVIETISCSDGWTYQVEMRDCGKPNCSKCPHGPYVYRHKTGPEGHLSEYVKRGEIPLEVKKESNELEA